MSTLKYWRHEYEELIEAAKATDTLALVMPAMAKR